MFGSQINICVLWENTEFILRKTSSFSIKDH
jgi:hypothetical protein